MFIRVVKRKLKNDIALDFKLLESYRSEPGAAPKHRHKKTWVIRQSDVGFKYDQDRLLEDIECDLAYYDLPKAKQTKLVSAVKKKLKELKK